MADTPTALSSARRILEVFRDQGLGAGHALAAGSFVAPFSKPGWTPGDFDAGVEYAVAEDWIEQVSADAYRLTADGAAER